MNIFWCSIIRNRHTNYAFFVWNKHIEKNRNNKNSESTMMTEEKYNCVKYFERSFREHWDLEAVTDYGTDVTLTYGQLAKKVAKLHILFRECGIKKNDKIEQIMSLF